MVIDNPIIDLEIDGRLLELELWDTVAREEYDRLRPLSYPNAAVIVMAFAIDNRESFRSVSERWLPEIFHFCGPPTPPILILGCKSDLRNGNDAVVDGTGLPGEVTVEEGGALAKQIGAVGYLECSAKTGEGVDDALEIVARAAISWDPAKRKTSCVIM